MKIVSNQPVRNNSIGRRDKKSAPGDASFAAELSPARATTAPNPASGVGAIDGILALQEVDEDGRGPRQEVDRGEDMLDRLEEIRRGLLFGTVDRNTLSQLLEQVKKSTGEAVDPRLKQILGEIEVRAAVELAKLGQSV